MSTKERVSPTETAPSMTREQALAALVEAEAQLNSDTAADALLVMIAVYFVLEASDGAEAPGVKELRSWLVGALETLGLPDEAAEMRQRGSFVEHPLSIMPSTWFKTSGAIATNSMSVDEAIAAVERGLGLLQAGDVDGLALLVDAYFALELQQGAESVDATTLRCFLVGLLEAGGFVDEGQSLRVRGSMVEPTAEDLQVYAATWLRILEAEQSAPVIDSGIDKQSLEGTTSDPPPSDPGGGEEPVDPEPKVVEKGSPIPSVGIDLGIGTFRPTLGSKGLQWTLGLDAHWTLFRAKFFGMQIGGGGQFGRNRDKRWLTDAWGGIGLVFDFEKIYFIPEFGGGYDGIAGGSKLPTEALQWAHAGYYHFGGKLGVRFGEKFGLYGRAVRVNRIHATFANETRVRGGFLVYLDKAAIDIAFVFTDYDSKGDNPSARHFGGILGFRF